MGWWHSKNFYKSGKEPVYKVGQVVYKMWRYDNETCMSMMQFSCEHEILEVSKKKSGFIWKEFTYKVKNLLNNEIIDGVYESELATEYQGIVYETQDTWRPLDVEGPKLAKIDDTPTKLEKKLMAVGYTSGELQHTTWADGKLIWYKHYTKNDSYIDLSEDGKTIISSSLTNLELNKLLK